MVYIFVCCIVITELKSSIASVKAKNLLISLLIEMPVTNALKSVGYMDEVLFLPIGKSDIYQHKSLDKPATDFCPNILKPERVTNKYVNWLPTYLNISVIELSDLPIHGDSSSPTLPIDGKITVSVYPVDFRCILQVAIPIAQEKR
jgi:hypothetical protein